MKPIITRGLNLVSQAHTKKMSIISGSYDKIASIRVTERRYLLF